MIPQGRFSDNTQLRIQARDKAYEKMWFDIYRHKMRYDPIAHKNQLGLDDLDIREIQKYYKQDEESQFPVKFVTINLPSDHDPDNSLSCLQRCLKKCYVGQWAYAFELGSNEDHPHYHVYFVSAVKWLAKSRIIQEWSKVFDL